MKQMGNYKVGFGNHKRDKRKQKETKGLIPYSVFSFIFLYQMKLLMT